jgi:hypothetical protein
VSRWATVSRKWSPSSPSPERGFSAILGDGLSSCLHGNTRHRVTNPNPRGESTIADRRPSGTAVSRDTLTHAVSPIVPLRGIALDQRPKYGSLSFPGLRQITGFPRGLLYPRSNRARGPALPRSARAPQGAKERETKCSPRKRGSVPRGLSFLSQMGSFISVGLCSQCLRCDLDFASDGHASELTFQSKATLRPDRPLD